MNGSRIFPFLICLLFFSGFIWNSAPQKVKEGNRLYEKKDYEGAVSRYQEAEAKRPNTPEIPFNMGNSFYRQKKYKEAVESHTRTAQLDSGTLKARAHYNIGNSLYRQGDSEGALEAYKKAVDLDPGDIDTKYNIEFLQRQMKGASQESQKQSGSQGEKEEPSSQEQEQKDQKEERQETGGFSKEDAERTLGALQAEERPLPMAPKEKEKKSQEPPVEKDW